MQFPSQSPPNASQGGGASVLSPVRFDDAFVKNTGRAYMTGMQALVRLALMQAERDAQAGWNTAGLITGYRGSPLGSFDTELQKNRARLKVARIVFQPGLNEDLAATALMGSQQAAAFGTARHDGVFGIWYGKGPGVDRTGDAFKHALRSGASARGGVLAVFGDDHPGKSSTVAHQSDPSLAAIGMPVVYPATLEELISFGLYGWAASRASGLWFGVKCVNETAEATSVVQLDHLAHDFVAPDLEIPPDGLGVRLAFDVAGDELRHIRYKLPAAEAFAKANSIDRVTFGARDAPLGIVTAGKSYLDVVDALGALGLPADGPVAVYKVGQIFPVERTGLAAFARGKRELLFIEEKTGLVEQQAAGLLFNMSAGERPRLVGKHDEAGARFAPDHGVLDAREVALLLGARLEKLGLCGEGVQARLVALRAQAEAQTRQQGASANRTPWFCSGCPHNTSTKAPEGSKSLTGIGCHTMAIWMNRDALPPAQMGGEGANWIGMAPFVSTEHVFQNLGDGTYNHSGLLAIRAAVAAKTRITFKVLFNDAVAMTGGQAHDGQLTVGDIVRQVQAERVARVVVVAEDPNRISGQPLPRDVAVHPREALDQVQRELRDIGGVTVLVYDQTCAAVLRRRRKRGLAPTPDRRVVINERVCEGCGDCSVKSNCTSVIPKPTELGLKRAIDQSGCNRDFSCINGFCPSFVELEGAELKLRDRNLNLERELANLPEPQTKPRADITNILVAGIGGTGVVTVGALIGMAAHIEGADMAVYDMTGLAQKGGAVYSHVRVRAKGAGLPFSPRLPPASADVLIGCEAQVSCAGDAFSVLSPGRTKAFLNEDVLAPGAFQIGEPVALETVGYQASLQRALGAPIAVIPATALAKTLLGDSVYANVIMLGFAFQRGVLPVSRAAIEQAIHLNGASVAKNMLAFKVGRIVAHDAQWSDRQLGLEPPRPLSLEDVIAHRTALLTAYQDASYADRYLGLVARARQSSAKVQAGEAFAYAVAENFAKLMAYKDEYEVARLYADGVFRAALDNEFTTPARISVWLAPPLIAPRDPRTGAPRKLRFGGWILPVFSMLARLKSLRGTKFDPFGRSAERRAERQLIEEYEATVLQLCDRLSAGNAALATEIARIPEDIRGFGHVKERTLKLAQARRERLMKKFYGAAVEASIAPVHAPASE